MSPRKTKATKAPATRPPRQARAAAAQPALKQVERYFFDHLRSFYVQNAKEIRRTYPELTRQFLAHNDPAKNRGGRPHRPGGEPLRVPQFEALEMYVFLKEYAGNRHVFEIFDDWLHRRGRFASRADLGTPTDSSRQGSILAEQDALELAAWETLFGRMKAAAHASPADIAPHFPSAPPNYIFALSMGVGKTRLMGVCVLYEFVMARKYPTDKRYAHNAIVFAPDTTVRDALREIEQMDFGAYLPPELANVVPPEIKPRVLDDDVTALQMHDGGDFHIVISNVQKILVRRRRAQPTPRQQFLDVQSARPVRTGAFAEADAFGDEPELDADLIPNQRFQKLLRALNLGIYIDEAHHAFGAGLAGNLGQNAPVDGERITARHDETAFRRTVRMLIEKLDKAGSRVVGTFCYTGTPYADGVMFPEVVYHYGLRKAIDDRILKQPVIHDFENVTCANFVDQVISGYSTEDGRHIKGFIETTAANDRRYEGMLPKLVFFANTIDEANDELRPLVEKAILKHGFPASAVLVNTGEASKDDEREFRRLDTVDSTKQFIILVGRGKEGWNCRSLFGVALYKEPRSRIFVLQATMRCLRAITTVQHEGHIYLSHQNAAVLNAELLLNFNLTSNDLGARKGGGGVEHLVRPLPPPRPIRLRRIRYKWDLTAKEPSPRQDLELAKLTDDDLAKYVSKISEIRNPFTPFEDKRHVVTTEVTAAVQRICWTPYSLVGECARYLQRSALEIEQVLRSSLEGIDAIVLMVNKYNDLLYDYVIPQLFKAFYDLKRGDDEVDEVEIELAPTGGDDMWRVHAKPGLVVTPEHPDLKGVVDIRQRSFHLNTYCFDSGSEHRTFFDLVKHKQVQQIYFTGMLTAGQTDFVVQYVDTSSHTLRSYYPDFVVQHSDGTWILVEVKGDNMADQQVVKDKARAARDLAAASSMRYAFLRSTMADAGQSYRVLTAGGLDDAGNAASGQSAFDM